MMERQIQLKLPIEELKEQYRKEEYILPVHNVPVSQHDFTFLCSVQFISKYLKLQND